MNSCLYDKSSKRIEDVDLEKFEFSNSLLDENTKSQKLSDLYSNVTGFELDMKGGAIGHVSKVIVFDNMLFVFDSHYAKKIFVYDINKKGEFLFSIGEKGKGPGEFTGITDFTIDSLNQQILVSDIGLQRISYFDLNGKFKTTKKTKYAPMRIACKGEFLYMTIFPLQGDERCLKVFDNNLNLITEYLKSEEYPSVVNYDSGFLKFKNRLLLNYPNCDTIFQIIGTQIKPYLILDSGVHSYYSNINKNELKLQDLNTAFNNYYRRKNNLFDNVVFPRIFFEDDRLITFEFSFDRKIYKFLKVKSNENTVPFIGYMFNDLFRIPISLVGYSEEYGTLGIIDAERMLNVEIELIEKNSQFLSENLISAFRNIDGNENPYVLILN